MPEIKVNGTKLYYEIRGKGNPIYILHGGPGLDHRYFGRSLTGLESYRKLYYIDFRGHGKSSKANKKTYTLETFTDDINALREALGHGTIEILGHSMGGFVALLYALRYPKHLDALILVDTTAKQIDIKRYFPLKAGLMYTKLKYNLQYLKNKTVDKESLDREILLKSCQIYVSDMFLPEYTDYVKSLRGVDIFFDMQQELQLFDVSGELENIHQPTLIIFGEKDPLMEGGRLLKRIRQSRFSVIPSAKSLPFLEDKKYFNMVVREFLTGKML